ncbi:carboxylesterase [Blastomyces dermatitidis ER-3]|uniref:Carboxylesterase n=2 Tax=Ajellomyces dermatitidis TaxID=5039 RepID=F2TI42_AJEDA|nr:carboxylesterase [Blastomyces dermatitidis ER-3]EEQ85935.2 carboxylesterase [Blastomyces dermatitidis ER-3]EGE82892.2 carboxylesterase [Blastomyces dermatitidis ATCC 18188]
MNLSLKGIISAVADLIYAGPVFTKLSRWNLQTHPKEAHGISSDSGFPERFPARAGVMFPDASDATFKRIHDLFPVPLNQPVETLARDRVTSALANLLIAV